MASLEQTRVVCMVALALGVCSLSACAVSTPVTLTSTQNSPQMFSQVEVLNQQDETGLRALFLSELSGSFTTRGVTVHDGADFVADFSVSERAAGVGLQEISEGAETGNAIEPLFVSQMQAQTGKRKPRDLCTRQWSSSNQVDWRISHLSGRSFSARESLRFAS